MRPRHFWLLLEAESDTQKTASKNHKKSLSKTDARRLKIWAEEQNGDSTRA